MRADAVIVQIMDEVQCGPSYRVCNTCMPIPSRGSTSSLSRYPCGAPGPPLPNKRPFHAESPGNGEHAYKRLRGDGHAPPGQQHHLQRGSVPLLQQCPPTDTSKSLALTPSTTSTTSGSGPQSSSVPSGLSIAASEPVIGESGHNTPCSGSATDIALANTRLERTQSTTSSIDEREDSVQEENETYSQPEAAVPQVPLAQYLLLKKRYDEACAQLSHVQAANADLSRYVCRLENRE